jgi:hypothetical protein
MERVRVFSMAAAVAGVLLLALSAGASATTPSWYDCAKAEPANSGNYKDSKCTEASEPGKGKYEILPGVGKGKAFKGAMGKMFWHMVVPGKGDFKTECESGKDEGTAATPNRVTGVKITLSKCKILGGPCKTEGGKLETITTEALEGELGWLSHGGLVAGLALTSEAEPGVGIIASFECEGFAKERWIGSIIATIAPVEELSKESTLTYAVGPYLGEVEPGYTPLTNPIEFEGSSTRHLFSTELNGPETGNKWEPVGGLPSGWEGVLANKGEDLLIE